MLFTAESTVNIYLEISETSIRLTYAEMYLFGNFLLQKFEKYFAKFF